MLYTQLFDQLFRLADSTPEYNGALPIHVRLMMDEFAECRLAQKLQKHFGRVPQPKYQLRHYFAEHCPTKKPVQR